MRLGQARQRYYDATPDGERFLGSLITGGATADPEDGEDADAFRRVNVILNWTEELKERLPVSD